MGKNTWQFKLDIELQIFLQKVEDDDAIAVYRVDLYHITICNWDIHTSMEWLNHFSAGNVLRRQLLTSEDVRLWHLKTIPALDELKKIYWQKS